MSIYLPKNTTPLNIALVEPKIPPNIGAISRICACTGSTLYIVGEVTFRENHPKRKRAGLDYWDKVEKIYIEEIDDFFEETGPNFYLFSTKVGNSIYEIKFKPGDFLVFGSETTGLPEYLLKKYQTKSCRIPMIKNIRSLNLANSVGIAAYEALRQIHFA
ncbi:MAG: tRNA (cytidine(34)-2'-O)-methyltransferase [Myxococcota bacterium]